MGSLALHVAFTQDRKSNYMSISLMNCILQTFREHRVDGKSLPLLTVEHLMQNIGMKLGPAVLLTKTVAKRLKVSRHAQRKCQKCDSKNSGLKSPMTCNIGMERVF